nr:putative MO25-like protein At5g47540 isoform X1 [Ipomoea batatas]
MLGNVVIRAFFKNRSRRPRNPPELVAQTTSLLNGLYSFDDHAAGKRFHKIAEIDTHIRDIKSILYGSSESEPAAEACAQLTQEFFKGNTMRLLILCLPKLNLEARKDATQVVANLQRQPVNSRLIASDYLEANKDLVDHLVSGYEDSSLALHYGAMLRECIRHQVVARHILMSEHVKKFFDYMQLPEFDVAADAATTFKELLTRHKSTVSEFLSENYNWFFTEFNFKLLGSPNYITRRQAVKLLGDILLDRSNSGVMIRYVNSLDNLIILMNLLRETSKPIQLDTFHVFKLFVANTNRPPGVSSVLANNKDKLLRLFVGLRTDKEDEVFEADKAQILKEIGELEPPRQSGDVYKLPRTPLCSGELQHDMAFCSPSTPAKLAVTVASFLGSVAMFAYGVHLSYVNIAPQQARTKARNDFVKDRIRKKYGKL